MEKLGRKHSVFVAGAGGIGSAVALFLRNPPDVLAPFEVDIYLGDINLQNAERESKWISEGQGQGALDVIEMPEEGVNATLEQVLEACDVVLDCTPGTIGPRIAQLARDYNCHYANLTEYVKETNAIIGIAKDAKTGFILQTGLAPGFINILAHSLYQDFREKHLDKGVEKVDYISMKVGALSNNAFPPHYYGFTWSPIGVATEYLEPATVIRNSESKTIPSLSARADIVINGFVYEEDLTSGGAANLPEFFAGKANSLDYKTLRHAGHYDWIDGLLNGMPESERRAHLLEAIMKEAVPRVEDDFVLIYASVQGKGKDGEFYLKEKVHLVEPIEVGGKKLRAIQATTAASLAECAVMLLSGGYKGVILQSEIDPEMFLNGAFVSMVYNRKRG